LSIIIGENASGKITIIYAIRMIHRDSEIGYISEDDLINYQKLMIKKDIHIDLVMKFTSMFFKILITSTRHMRSA